VPTTFTTADLDAIRKAIARGERVVQFSDRMVTYRSMDELLAAEARIAAALADRPRQTAAYAGKGL
jgi:hypothetical protein